jgi:hypothetical protein
MKKSGGGRRLLAGGLRVGYGLRGCALCEFFGRANVEEL